MRFTFSVLFFIFTSIILNQAEEKSDEDDDERKLENIGGIPVPRGMYGFLIFFMLKPYITRISNFKELPNGPNDDTVHTSFLCSGTLLNRRWALTRAKPLVYYKAHYYWLVADSEFSPSESYRPEMKYDVTWVAFHKKYKHTRKLEFDVAMVRTAQDILFTLDIHPVNIGFSTLPEPETLDNCRLIVWNWNRNTKHKMSSKNEKVMIRRAEIPVEVPEDCLNANVNVNDTDYVFYLNCIKQNLTESHFPFDQPCALNLGAPVVCGGFQQLWGVFIGDRGISECEGQTFKDTDNLKEYDIVNIHKPKQEEVNHTIVEKSHVTIDHFIGKVMNKDTYVNLLEPVLGHFNLSDNHRHLHLGDDDDDDDDETE